jgi:hypothetical protein
MTIIATTCPHCDADRPLDVQKCVKRNVYTAIIFTICPTCRLPVSLLLTQGADESKSINWFLEISLGTNVDMITETNWMIIGVFPALSKKNAPEFTPPDVAKLYVQAISSQARQEREAAAFLFGKVLELAIKTRYPDTTGTLAQRIDTLADRGHCKEVKEWAHEIRIIRNIAVHETVEPHEEDIVAIAEFTEAFLMVVFTMNVKYAQRASSLLS